MANFNKILLMGNLTRDPQLKYLPSQTAVVEFGLAVNHRFRTANGEDREEVMFIDCTAFGKQAEVINQYCQKGKQLFVEGRLKLDQWDDKQTGQKRSRLGVVLESFSFLDSGGRGDAAPGGPAPAPRPRPATTPTEPSAPDDGGPAAAAAEDDVPF